MAAERYAKVTRRMWSDERFRALSKPQPNAQSLWLFLLTGPTRGGIPGLLNLGEGGLAEAIGWTRHATRKHLLELEAASLVIIDRTSNLIWLPKALRHNAPESPNVVLSWSASWRELPECQLKTDATEAAKAFLATLGKGEAFAEAFRQAIGEVSRKPSRKTSPNQEQEQEQEQLPRTAGASGPPNGGEGDPCQETASRLAAILAHIPGGKMVGA